MKKHGKVYSRFWIPIICFILLLGMFGVRGESDPAEGNEQKEPDKAAASAVADHLIAVPPPPFTEGIFPCSSCHEYLDTDTTPRKLEDEHADIVFEHDAKNRWCLDCHNAANRDKLHLASGKLVDFTESYNLCGQCHGPKLRDWKAGDHGKRTGSWSGKKQYLLCAHCHDPHSPKFKSQRPQPAPVRQKDIK